MVMAAPIRTSMAPAPMLTDAQALTLARWLSPGYPIGAYAYSHGLETAVSEQRVHDRAALEAWLRDLLEHGAGRNDGLLLAAAYQASETEIRDIDATARAFAASRERILETDQQGAAFCRTETRVSGGPDGALAYPVAIGAAAARHQLPLGATLAMYLQAFTANLVSAAQRLVPLGQTDGQRVQAALAPLCVELAATCEGGSLDDLTSTSFLGDMASMRHETQTTRLFRT